MSPRLIRSCVVAGTAVAMALFTLSTTFAQSYLDAGSKARGNFGSSSASRAMRNARSYSQEYRQYASSAPKVDPEVAQETTDAIGVYITKAKKHMAWMRKQADKGQDKETLASLDKIDKDLADAEKAHKEMCEVCKAENINPDESMKCCQTIDSSLEKAITEHDKLMKRLGMSTPAAK